MIFHPKILLFECSAKNHWESAENISRFSNGGSELQSRRCLLTLPKKAPNSKAMNPSPEPAEEETEPSEKQEMAVKDKQAAMNEEADFAIRCRVWRARGGFIQAN